ncbi:50S ribosomal protein L13 [Candidatus Woesearchaeota archaeon]|nr:50S ribosomal protein L13 [Candidatus Woesearchaeota archaeon]MBW3016821.1 50S ribosomal protein L13 [Candidatus Woesearchaeota archaeon]
MIIDATDLIVGRLATRVAKAALLGEQVDVVNCEHAVISGNPKQVYDRLKEKATIGSPHHGPYYPKKADRFVRRVIRNMLPHKQYKGEIALKRIKCYLGVPEEFEGKKLETIKEANYSKLPTRKAVKVGEVLKLLK